MKVSGRCLTVLSVIVYQPYVYPQYAFGGCLTYIGCRVQISYHSVFLQTRKMNPGGGCPRSHSLAKPWFESPVWFQHQRFEGPCCSAKLYLHTCRFIPLRTATPSGLGAVSFPATISNTSLTKKGLLPPSPHHPFHEEEDGLSLMPQI